MNLVLIKLRIIYLKIWGGFSVVLGRCSWALRCLFFFFFDCAVGIPLLIAVCMSMHRASAPKGRVITASEALTIVASEALANDDWSIGESGDDDALSPTDDDNDDDDYQPPQKQTPGKVMPGKRLSKRDNRSASQKNTTMLLPATTPSEWSGRIRRPLTANHAIVTSYRRRRPEIRDGPKGCFRIMQRASSPSAPVDPARWAPRNLVPAIRRRQRRHLAVDVFPRIRMISGSNSCDHPAQSLRTIPWHENGSRPQVLRLTTIPPHLR